MASQTQQWLDGLKAGDSVAIFDYKGSTFRHTAVVTKRTPSGRIVCSAESAAFKSDGYQIGSTSDRCLRPVSWDGNTRRVEQPGPGLSCSAVVQKGAGSDAYKTIDVLDADGFVIHEAVYYPTTKALIAVGVQVRLVG